MRDPQKVFHELFRTAVRLVGKRWMKLFFLAQVFADAIRIA